MRVRRIAGLAVVLFSCASTDLGNPCQLQTPAGASVSPAAGQDIVQIGSGECQQFVCASFDGATPICSQPCTVAGATCGSGLICREAVLTPQLLVEAQATQQGQALLSGVSEALYCGPSGTTP